MQTGVVVAIGQDMVQAIMAMAFSAVRAEADGDVVRDLDPAGYLDQHKEAPERRAVAKSTIVTNGATTGVTNGATTGATVGVTNGATICARRSPGVLHPTVRVNLQASGKTFRMERSGWLP